MYKCIVVGLSVIVCKKERTNYEEGKHIIWVVHTRMHPVLLRNRYGISYITLYKSSVLCTSVLIHRSKKSDITFLVGNFTFNIFLLNIFFIKCNVPELQRALQFRVKKLNIAPHLARLGKRMNGKL